MVAEFRAAVADSKEMRQDIGELAKEWMARSKKSAETIAPDIRTLRPQFSPTLEAASRADGADRGSQKLTPKVNAAEFS